MKILRIRQTIVWVLFAAPGKEVCGSCREKVRPEGGRIPRTRTDEKQKTTTGTVGGVFRLVIVEAPKNPEFKIYT